MEKAPERVRFPGAAALDWLVRIEMWIAMALLVAMIAVNVAEIVGRYFFSHSFIWIQDVTLLLASWMIFLGFVAVAYHGKDIAVTYLVEKLPAPVQMLTGVLVPLGAMAFLSTLIWKGFALMEVQGDDLTHMAHIPTRYFTWSLIVAACSLLLVTLSDLVNNLSVSRKRGEAR